MLFPLQMSMGHPNGLSHMTRNHVNTLKIKHCTKTFVMETQSSHYRKEGFSNVHYSIMALFWLISSKETKFTPKILHLCVLDLAASKKLVPDG